jgi:molecular chaperone DnaK (HSP70)
MTQVTNALKNELGDAKIVSYEPDEIVARGAAWKAHELDIGGCTIKDISGKSYGIKAFYEEEDRSKISIIIPKNTELSTSMTMSYSPLEDNLDAVSLIVYETDIPRDSAELIEGEEKGRADLILPPNCKSSSTIDVTLSLDSSGRLFMSAEEQESRNICELELDINGVLDYPTLAKKVNRAKHLKIGRD